MLGSIYTIIIVFITGLFVGYLYFSLTEKAETMKLKTLHNYPSIGFDGDCKIYQIKRKNQI